jgi:transaldolase
MEIFIDSASVKDIEKWLLMGVVDGVTTNPSIMFKDGVYDIQAGAKEIAALIKPKPLSIEVTTNSLDEMFIQARQFTKWATNIVIKIPQINADGIPCYGVIKQLEDDGIKINATVALSFGQVILAAKANATYISIFTGRVSDEGGNSAEIVKYSIDWLERWKFKSKVIVGSIRSVGDILTAAISGAHIITIPPDLLDKMADHKYSRATVKQFIDDAQKAQEMMRKVRETHIEDISGVYR